MPTHRALMLMVAFVLSPVAANAQLTAVTVDGDQMVSDATLDVTWADVASPLVSWSASGAPGSAQAWVASLNTEDYGGYDNWMLATGDPTYTTGSCGTGCGASTSATANQLDYLFINELGNTPGAHNTSFGPFTTLSGAGYYWSATADASVPGFAWHYNTYQGKAFYDFTFRDFQTLAVRSGDVSAVPEPGIGCLVAMGFLGLAGRSRWAARRQREG
jgi:hypothetical protein